MKKEQYKRLLSVASKAGLTSIEKALSKRLKEE
jgi:hypothetical protein